MRRHVIVNFYYFFTQVTTIVQKLKENMCVLVPWTDGQGTQYNLIFIRPYVERGSIVGIGNPIIGIQGGHCAQIEDKYDIHTSYIAEKLHLPRESITTELLTDFINLILKQL